METINKDTGENAEVKFELDENPGLKFSDLAFLSQTVPVGCEVSESAMPEPLWVKVGWSSTS